MGAEAYQTPSGDLAPSGEQTKGWNGFRRYLPALRLATSRGSAVGLQLLVQVVVGALAGSAGLGVLQLFMSWSSMLAEVLGQGLPTHSMRRVAVLYPRGDTDKIALILKRATRRILGAAVLLILSGVAFSVIGLFDAQRVLESDSILVVMAVFIGAPLFAWQRLWAETLKAVDAPLVAVTLENLLIPLVALVFCSVYWAFGWPLNTLTLLVAGVSGFAATWLGLVGSVSKRIDLNSKVSHGERKLFDEELCSLWLSGVLSIVFLHLPFLVLPWYANTSDIGIYAVAHKLVNVATTLLILLGAVFGPAFARAAGHKNRRELWRLLWKTQVISTAIFVPITATLLLSSGPLSTVFNVDGRLLMSYLLILSLGHLVNSITGLSGVLLNMSGGARLELGALCLSLFLALSITPVVGANYGAIGLAWLFSITIIFKNVVSYILAIRYLKTVGEVL
jgi:O-antigen/teichoic acid export membrane protein